MRPAATYGSGRSVNRTTAGSPVPRPTTAPEAPPWAQTRTSPGAPAALGCGPPEATAPPAGNQLNREGNVSTPYAEFIGKKEQRLPETGIAATTGQLHPLLHDWQREIVTWACRVGRAAVWADTGLGKTIMQLSWLNVMRRDGIGVVVAPLAVCRQTVQEARKIGITAEYVREMPTKPGVYVTNYEMVHHLHPDAIAAVVLDEASILKQSDGKTRTMLIGHFRDVPYRLACTATPAPNDP